MTDTKDQEQRAPHEVGSFSTPLSYVPFARALSAFCPPGTRRADIVAFFEHKAPWHSIENWKRGLSRPPQWAIDLLEQRASAALDAAKKIKPGIKAGPENLRRWNARNKG